MASQGAPNSYLDFSPPGRPGVRFKPDQAVVPGNIESRRAHMDAFFKHMGHTDEVLLEKERRVAVQWVCALFRKKGFLRCGLQHFEFEVDRNLWYNIFEDYRDQGVPGPEWPWDRIRLMRTDRTQGLSQVYADFLEEKKASGAAAASKDATPNEGSKAFKISKEAPSPESKNKPVSAEAPVRKPWDQIQENHPCSIRDLEQRLQSNEARTRRAEDEIRALKSQLDEIQALRAPDPTRLRRS
ncbi:hypothetical protein BKA56DRAFT_674044 [Ilyonectria sp. MPI-CAGE-AT-0026]|nr:hypothetical protein BKA56DRAFT_674044 [Ilyonectria sp. MPI-CAGE-AT-0026]